ncbi:MAG: Bcr/CflA family efflux MFS transporter, partial [Rickettsiaceae bacterium]|nr:Bcr/CflA family efflux MFS transporter [Rickettsiaceae bacterium]
MKVIGRIQSPLLCCLVSLSVLSETIYSPALPEITKSLNTEGGIAQMSSTAYFIGFALGIFTLGRISDIFGRRPVILFGVLFYSIISLLISYSPNIEIFITLRFFQAYGASISSVVAQAMIRDSYTGWELSSMFASVPIIMSATAFIGTILGGYIVEYYNWQYIFRFLVAVSGFYLILYLFKLPETNPYIGSHSKNSFFRVVKVVLQDKVLLCYAFIVGSVNGIV